MADEIRGEQPESRMDGAGSAAALQGLAARWRLDIGEQLSGGYQALVFECRNQAGNRVVLKLPPPLTRPHLEAAALAHWSGRGAAGLLDRDPGTGAMLLEQILPGDQMPRKDDDASIRAAGRVLKTLHASPLPRSGIFPEPDEALAWNMEIVSIDAEPGAVGSSMLGELVRSVRRLNSSARRRVLLHGDFITKNLLLGPHGHYIAIDPLPRLGEPCSDVGFFAAYCPPARNIADRARRLAIEAGQDPARAAKWAACWAIGEACETWREDSDELQRWVAGDECRSLLEAC